MYICVYICIGRLLSHPLAFAASVAFHPFIVDGTRLSLSVPFYLTPGRLREIWFEFFSAHSIRHVVVVPGVVAVARGWLVRFSTRQVEFVDLSDANQRAFPPFIRLCRVLRFIKLLPTLLGLCSRFPDLFVSHLHCKKVFCKILRSLLYCYDLIGVIIWKEILEKLKIYNIDIYKYNL